MKKNPALQSHADAGEAWAQKALARAKKGEVPDSNLQTQVGHYLAKLHEARLYVHRDKPKAKALFLEVETLLKAIPGGIVTVNKVADAVDKEWYEARIKKYETGMLNAITKLHEWERQYASNIRKLTEESSMSHTNPTLKQVWAAFKGKKLIGVIRKKGNQFEAASVNQESGLFVSKGDASRWLELELRERQQNPALDGEERRGESYTRAQLYPIPQTGDGIPREPTLQNPAPEDEMDEGACPHCAATVLVKKGVSQGHCGICGGLFTVAS